MTTLDTLALQRSVMMLRDQHYRINTTRLKHRKLSPYQQPVISVVITFFEAILLRHSKSFFVTSVTPMPSSGCISDAAASVQHLPAVEENATNDLQRRDEVCPVMAVNDGERLRSRLLP
jgi:hypothetical protein